MVTKLKTGTKVGQLGIWDGTQWVAGDPDCNIVKWGGTALTGRDISLDLKTFTDAMDTDKHRVLPLAKGKTIITVGQAAENGSTILRTVTAGKTFYLVAATLQTYIYVTTSNGTCYVENDVGGNGAFTQFMYSSVGLVGSTDIGRMAMQSISPSIPMPFTAGTVIRVTSNAANTVGRATIMGWEE